MSLAAEGSAGLGLTDIGIVAVSLAVVAGGDTYILLPVSYLMYLVVDKGPLLWLP